MPIAQSVSSAHPALRVELLLAAMLTLSLGGCGGGGGSSSSTGSGSSSIVLSMPTTLLAGDLAVPYTLVGGGQSNVWFEFSRDGGVTWNGAAPANGCENTKNRTSGSHVFLWDTVADDANGPVQVRGHAGSSTATLSLTLANPSPTFLDRSATINAATTTGIYTPIHRGFYDLSPTRLRYLDQPAFPAATAALPVKSWRISVGRWEVGPVSLFAPEAAAYSTNPSQLQTCSREFYHGPNTLAGAAIPANYNFAYLDGAIAAATACGAEPYLCFDYMPFTLAANQDPNTADNLYLGNSALSFSNGIRTSPPSNPIVYAEVVKQTVLHVTGTFANGLNHPLSYVEIGNEPDLPSSATTYSHYFWTGTSAQFTAMYVACAQTLDTQFGSSIAIGAGSFAFFNFEVGPTFMERFLAGLGSTRLDFLGFHCYGDAPETDFVGRIVAAKALRDTYRPAAKLFCPEWNMNLDDGNTAKFQSMTAALHHAKALEYFTLLGVSLAHCAPLRDPVDGSIGLITLDAQLKPAAYAFSAYEMLAQTKNLLLVTAIAPAGKPMLLASGDSTGITVLFFHEKPPTGQVGRMMLTIANLPFPNWTVERRVLTDATVAIGDGLWLARKHSQSGAFTEELHFTQDTLVVWRITASPPAMLKMSAPIGNG